MSMPDPLDLATALFGPDPGVLPGRFTTNHDGDTWFRPAVCHELRLYVSETLGSRRMWCGRPLNLDGRCPGHRYAPIRKETTSA